MSLWGLTVKCGSLWRLTVKCWFIWCSTVNFSEWRLQRELIANLAVIFTKGYSFAHTWIMQLVLYIKTSSLVFPSVLTHGRINRLNRQSSTNLDKSLGTNLHLWRSFTRAKQTVTREFIYTCSAPHPPPFPQCKTLVHATSTLYSGGGGGEQRFLKQVTVLFLAPF